MSRSKLKELRRLYRLSIKMDPLNASGAIDELMDSDCHTIVARCYVDDSGRSDVYVPLTVDYMLKTMEQ